MSKGYYTCPSFGACNKCSEIFCATCGHPCVEAPESKAGETPLENKTITQPAQAKDQD